MPTKVTSFNCFVKPTETEYLATPELGEDYAVLLQYADKSFDLGVFTSEDANIDIIISAIKNCKDLSACQFYASPKTSKYVLIKLIPELQQFLSKIVFEVKILEITDKLLVNCKKTILAKQSGEITSEFSDLMTHELQEQHKDAAARGLIQSRPSRTMKYKPNCA